MIPRDWQEAIAAYYQGKLSGEDLILFADQCAPRHSDFARKLVARHIERGQVPRR